MGETTSISVHPDTKQQLENDHRADGHHSWDDVLTGMMRMLPTVEDILESGCAYHDCDKQFFSPSTPEDKGGTIQFFHAEVPPDDHDVYGATYFCSPEHAAAAQEEMSKYVPEHPDEVVVGGADAMRTTIEGARFFLDYDTMEVGIDAPGAFVGEDSYGNEYDYVGEPVYVIEDGQVRQHGVIDDIIHEEVHTALILGRGDRSTVMLNHPDDERRQSFIEDYCHWYDQDCPECGAEVRVHEAMDAEIECGECGATAAREPAPEGDIPDAVLEHRTSTPTDLNADGTSNDRNFTVSAPDEE